MKTGRELMSYGMQNFRSRTVFHKSETVKSFYEAIGPVVLLGQPFGLLPVSGFLHKNSSRLRFNIYSPISIYSLVLQIIYVLELGLLFKFMSNFGFQFHMIGQAIFTSVCTFGGVYFFYLATKWKQLMIRWEENEKLFLVPPYASKLKTNFSRKILILSIVITTLSICDHFIHLKSAIEKVDADIGSCNETLRDFWKILYVDERKVFLSTIPYYSWEIPFFEWYEITKTMCWTYSEIFVSCVSITLAMRFDQLTNRLKQFRHRYVSDNFWHEIRCHYNVLCDLVIQADEIISPFILVYCFSNMFFICQKLFIQFEKKRAKWERYYSYYSSVFLIARTVSMLYFGASVNEKSNEAKFVMRDVPTKSFSGVDYRRLLDVIHSNSVALSGSKFFYVTKGMILTLAGTILTYELVLLQQIEDIAEQDNITTSACGVILQ
ncbi:unnamed protein product [Diamesa hyperborea]